MNYIVFDLEWNQCPYGKERENKRLPFEIIEIGALKLDENRNYEDSFHQVVKPVVYKNSITGRRRSWISKARIWNRDSFYRGSEKFMKWCGPEAKFCTWGSSDLAELQRNMKYYHMLNLLKGPIFYYDIQKLLTGT